MIRKPHWFLHVAIIAAFALLAQTAAFADTTLRIWSFLDPAKQSGREKVLKKLIENFEAKNPGVKVQVETQAWQTLADKFLTAHSLKNAPDVIWVRHSRLHEIVAAGALANLDNLFVKNWSAKELEDVKGPMWDYGARPGAHYQVMHHRFITGTFYRTDLFKAAGIDPKSLTTWEKFIAAAQKVTQKDASGNVAIWGYLQAYPTDGANLSIMANVLLDEQGNIFDAKGNANWANDIGLKGMNLQLDLIRKYKVSPETAISMNTDDDMYDQFNAGRVAMIHGGVARLPAAQAKLGAQNVGFLRTPSYKEGHYSPAEMGGWAIAIWSGSPNLTLAGKWLEFMSNSAADEMWVKEAGMIPIRKSTIANNPEFFSKPENAYLTTAFEEVATGWVQPEGAVGGYQDDLNRAAQEIYVKNADPMTALKKAQDAYNKRRRQ
jgi:multiple sugar transport system substrate-binding protein